ncbi:PAS domain S-box protein [Thermodesulfobacteriota bacterium]
MSKKPRTPHCTSSKTAGSTAGAAVFTIDASGCVVAINRAFTAMLGYTEEDITALNYTDISAELCSLSGKTAVNITNFALYYFNVGEKKPIPMQMIRKDGSRVDVCLHTELQRDADGNLVSGTGFIEAKDRGAPLDTPSVIDSDAKRFWEIEQNYKSILDHSGDAVIITDFNGWIQTVNTALQDMLGYDQKEAIIGKYLLEFIAMEGSYVGTTGNTIEIDQKYYQQQIDTINTLFEQGQAKSIGYLVKKDNTVVPVESTMSILRDMQGERRGTICICRDITDRILAQRDLLESEERLRSIYENSPIGIALFNFDFKLVSINKSCLEMFGIDDSREVLGVGFFDGSEAPSEVTDKLLKGQTVRFEWHLDFEKLRTRKLLRSFKEGTCFFDVLLTPYAFKTGGTKDGYLVQMQDITVQKKAEQQLLNHRDMLEEEVRKRTKALEETNTALTVMVRRRDQEKKNLERRMLLKLNDLVIPYVEKIKSVTHNQKQKSYLDIIENNLKEIINPIMLGHSNIHLMLTPSEIQVANLIKLGNNTLDIAELLNLSEKTVESHRKSIRKKLGIKDRKVNLRTYLLSLQ